MSATLTLTEGKGARAGAALAGGGVFAGAFGAVTSGAQVTCLRCCFWGVATVAGVSFFDAALRSCCSNHTQKSSSS